MLILFNSTLLAYQLKNLGLEVSFRRLRPAHLKFAIIPRQICFSLVSSFLVPGGRPTKSFFFSQGDSSGLKPTYRSEMIAIFLKPINDASLSVPLETLPSSLYSLG